MIEIPRQLQEICLFEVKIREQRRPVPSTIYGGSGDVEPEQLVYLRGQQLRQKTKPATEIECPAKAAVCEQSDHLLVFPTLIAIKRGGRRPRVIPARIDGFKSGTRTNGCAQPRNRCVGSRTQQELPDSIMKNCDGARPGVAHRGIQDDRCFKATSLLFHGRFLEARPSVWR